MSPWVSRPSQNALTPRESVGWLSRTSFKVTMVGVMALAHISPKALRQQGAGHGGSPRTFKDLRVQVSERLTEPVSAGDEGGSEWDRAAVPREFLAPTHFSFGPRGSRVSGTLSWHNGKRFTYSQKDCVRWEFLLPTFQICARCAEGSDTAGWETGRALGGECWLPQATEATSRVQCEPPGLARASGRMMLE